MEFFSNDRSRKLGVTMLEIQHQKAHNISLGIRAVHNNSGLSYLSSLPSDMFVVVKPWSKSESKSEVRTKG